MSTLTHLRVSDVRFPTSRELDGSDAMNPDPTTPRRTWSCAPPTGDAGWSLVFTIGRGNDLQCAAIELLAGHLVGLDVEETLADLGGLSRRLVGDSQLRWLGAREGRHAHGHRRGRQRPVGSPRPS